MGRKIILSQHNNTLLMKKILIALSLLTLVACNDGKKQSETSEQSQVVNVYTHRHYEADQNLFEKFEEKYGIKVNVTNASADELIQKMNMEGEHSPADVLITVDAGRLARAKEQGLLQAIDSEILEESIPAHLQDDGNQWFGFTKRARIIVYAKDRVNTEELSTYEDLTNEKWKNKLLIRSSGNIYNQSLLASIIAHNGEEQAKEWTRGIVANMARAPKGSDRDQVKAVVAGEGDLAIVNSYYVGQMLNSSDNQEIEIAKQVGIYFPNQEGRGTHINVSGAGVAKHAPNKENAVLFVEYLISEEAQEIFSKSNYEYPINKNIAPSPTVQDWGTFKEDELNLTELGKNNKKAVLIFDETGWK